MAGKLSEHPLGEIIREISSEGLSGAIRLTRERAKVSVYFEAGEVIYAGSNLRTYRLSECVRRWSVLSPKQLERVQESNDDVQFSESLVESGVLSQDAVNELLNQQVCDVLRHALLWTEGEWDFDPRVRLSTQMRVDVEMQQPLRESARRLPAAFAASSFSNSNEILVAADDVPDDIELLPTEAFVLSRIDGPMRVHELVAISGLPEGEILSVAYALALGGSLKRDRWPGILSDDDIARARVLLSSARKPEEPAPKPKPAPAGKKRGPQAPVVVDEKAELEDLFSRLRLSTNFYQMLGVVRPATDTDVKRAYHALAKRFHPDRFRRTVDDHTHSRIEAAFVSIAEAYETLRNKTSRATYDSKLLTQTESESRATVTNTTQNATPDPVPAEDSSADVAPPSPVHPSMRSHSADELFAQGLSALKAGNKALAVSCLAEAARLNPSSARFRAQYGRALAADERLRRNAEAELKAAISLNANNADYRVMLAELYVRMGFDRRAYGEALRALSIDPKHSAARALLEKLR